MLMMKIIMIWVHEVHFFYCTSHFIYCDDNTDDVDTDANGEDNDNYVNRSP